MGRRVRHSREFKLEAVRLLELGQKSGSELAPSLADLFIVGVAPIDYSPILLLKLFGFRIAPDTLSSTGLRRWPARHYPCLWIQRPSSERWRDFNRPDSHATQHTP